MASLDNMTFHGYKQGNKYQASKKLQDTMELDYLVKNIDQQLYSAKPTQKYTSINTLSTERSLPRKNSNILESLQTNTVNTQSSRNSRSISPVKQSPLRQSVKLPSIENPPKLPLIEKVPEEKDLDKQIDDTGYMLIQLWMKEFQQDKLNGEDSIEPNFDEMDSKEVIQWHIKKFTMLRNAIKYIVPPEHMVKCKGTQNLHPYDSFPRSQASTILPFKKGETIILLGVIDENWLIGYVEEDLREAVKIFPKTFVRLEYYYLPLPMRKFDVPGWESFGTSKKFVRHDDPPYFDPSVIAFKSRNDSPIHKKSYAKPKLICRALRDFNFRNPKEFIFNDIPALSFVKHQLIVITKLPNKGNWCEGYCLYIESVRLGLFPYDFVAPVEIKIK